MDEPAADAVSQPGGVIAELAAKIEKLEAQLAGKGKRKTR